MMRIGLYVVALATLLMAGCPRTPTDVDVVATLSGGASDRTLTQSHGADLTGSASILFANETFSAGNIEALSLDVSHTGVATSTGYELVAVLNRFGVGGGSIFTGKASAGDRRLLFAHTGQVAKTSYYFFEDSGGSSSFSPTVPNARVTQMYLARVNNNGANSVARVPFTNPGAAANFLALECLTGGDDPCFDTSTLIATLFNALSSAVQGAVSEPLTLGGDGADGDMRLDYLSALEVRRGCGANPARDPGFGFLFGATIDAPLGIRTRIHIPIVFSLLPDGQEIEVRVHPFFDAGGCQEMQFIDAISVSTTTFLGVGAQQIADTVQTNIVCSLFGPEIGDFECEGIDPSPLPELLTSGLAAMAGNTLTFHWREAYGDTPIPDNLAVFIRPRNADNVLTTTNATPGAAGVMPLDIVLTR